MAAEPSNQAAREAFYQAIWPENLTALWSVMKGIVTPAPASGCVPYLWPYARVRERLLEAAELITANRKFCKKKVGSARFERWLASYQGRNDVRKKRYCIPGKGTWRVIDYRRTLMKKLKLER